MSGIWFRSITHWFPNHPRLGWILGKITQYSFITMITGIMFLIPVMSIEAIYIETSKTYTPEGKVESNQTESFLFEYHKYGYFMSITITGDENYIDILVAEDSVPNSINGIVANGAISGNFIIHNCLDSNNTNHSCDDNPRYSNYVKIGYIIIEETDFITISNNQSIDLYYAMSDSLQTPFMANNIIEETTYFILPKMIDYGLAFIILVCFTLGLTRIPPFREHVKNS